jgi:hypothetical protein
VPKLDHAKLSCGRAGYVSLFVEYLKTIKAHRSRDGKQAGAVLAWCCRFFTARQLSGNCIKSSALAGAKISGLQDLRVGATAPASDESAATLADALTQRTPAARESFARKPAARAGTRCLRCNAAKYQADQDHGGERMDRRNQRRAGQRKHGHQSTAAGGHYSAPAEAGHVPVPSQTGAIPYMVASQTAFLGQQGKQHRSLKPKHYEGAQR